MSEAVMLNPGIEDSTAHESKPNNGEIDQGRMLIIASDYQRSFDSCPWYLRRPREYIDDGCNGRSAEDNLA